MTADFRVVPAGDAMFVVEFPERIDPAVNARAVAVAEALRAEAVVGVRDVVPTYRSVAVSFDPLATRYDELQARVIALASGIEAPERLTRAPIDVPVRYGGEQGPDLDAVAAFAGLERQEVIALHTAATYRVYMVGFLPGFAYLGTVDSRIAMPRHATPRLKVSRGAVGIAGSQTGIYPVDTPGGWQIIGHTDLAPFDLSRPEPFLFKAGDAVRFRDVTRS